MPFLAIRDDYNISLNIYVQPKASRTKITGIHDNSLKISTTAPPVDGKANHHVTVFLAKLFKLPKTAVTILAGHQSRHKTVVLEGISPEKVRQILGPFL